MMMKLTAEEQAFQTEVRAFIFDNLPADIKHKVDSNLMLKKTDHVRWEKILHQGGYYGASWPKAYGGSDWSVIKRYIFEQENALAGAPFIVPYGVNMVGPVIYTFGNDEQKKKYLPNILNNSVWWCQGYSEPNSGSDLASLKCSAKREGDEYVINGSKMWTTQAHYADMMHILVRTDDSGRKQQGISFLLLDMKTPGITITPIVTVDGLHHTNQTFFDDVRVPVENLIGEEGDGWKIATFLLQHERTAIADTGAKARAIVGLKAHLMVVEGILGNSPVVAVFRYRLAQVEAELMAVVAIEQRMMSSWKSGAPLTYEASVLKVRATELQQTISVLLSDLNGSYKAVYDVNRVDEGEHLTSVTPAQHASSASYLYLYGRCASIYGGSNQIQKNIIAKMA